MTVKEHFDKRMWKLRTNLNEVPGLEGYYFLVYYVDRDMPVEKYHEILAESRGKAYKEMIKQNSNPEFYRKFGGVSSAIRLNEPFVFMCGKIGGDFLASDQHERTMHGRDLSWEISFLGNR